MDLMILPSLYSHWIPIAFRKSPQYMSYRLRVLSTTFNHCSKKEEAIGKINDDIPKDSFIVVLKDYGGVAKEPMLASNMGYYI